MKIYKYIHSCLLAEEDGHKLLIDPGKYTFASGTGLDIHNFMDVSIILITHEHHDHLHIPAVKAIQASTGAIVVTNSSVKTTLAKQDIEARVLENDVMKLEKFTIQAVTSDHERGLNQVTTNNSYLINERLLHPGDSLNPKLQQFKGVHILALPIIAGWGTKVQIADFAKDISPKIIIPIHDGFIKDSYRFGRYRDYAKYFAKAGSDFKPLVNTNEFIEA
jgi:L-ascorbate metabolism protein UlaG (beta-lactamase superfamily)